MWLISGRLLRAVRYAKDALMSDEFDKRVTELEMTVTHQEQTINELSDVITEQWESIEKLRRQISKLDATKADIDPEEEADRRPPHY